VLLVDANVLLHAVNTDAPEHDQARDWLEVHLGSAQVVGFPWAVLLAFIRISTHGAIFPSPLSTDEAFTHVEQWLTRRNVIAVSPTTRHLSILRGLLEPLGTAGNLTTDAHLAALAVEHGASLVSFDRDFSRFPGLWWRHPADST
jgi:uncharacterized protein